MNNTNEVTSRTDQDEVPEAKAGDRASVHFDLGSNSLRIFATGDGQFDEPTELTTPTENPSLTEVAEYLLEQRFRVLGEWHIEGEQAIADVEFLGNADQ
ncbi:hypothetical protein [Nocardia neocaledoniensis]|uniref:hypothetical protein n=1 Tax=Nocardia neocaledoniensis TaxID=236511 RepID=UPI002455D434|nr:hypothetical protein [Nocardia neocaledoniensis]